MYLVKIRHGLKLKSLLIPGVVVTGGTVVVDAVVDDAVVVDAVVDDDVDAVVDDVDDDVVVDAVVDVVVGGAGVGRPMAGSGLAMLPKTRFCKSDAVNAIPNTGISVSRSSTLCLAVSSTNWSNVSSAPSNSKARQIPKATDTTVKAG